MHRIAFKMKVFAGKEREYERRHDEIWPELTKLLQGAGVSDYSIFLDEETGELLGVLKAQDAGRLDRLKLERTMQKWWAFMSDIMETNPDKSPVTRPLREVFRMPEA